MFNSLEVEFGRIFRMDDICNLNPVCLNSCEFGYTDVFKVMTVQPQTIFELIQMSRECVFMPATHTNNSKLYY